MRKGLRFSFLSFLFPLILVFEIASGTAAAWAGQGRWTPVGPGKGIYGWNYGVRSVATHPASPGTVWAGLPSGGLYKSTDRGLTWTWVGRPFRGYGVRALAADLSSPGALWAATEEGFFHTGDGGARWTRLSGETYTAALGGEEPVALSAAPRALYLRTGKRLLASADGGAVWQTVFDAGESQLVLGAVRPTVPAVLYLATSDSRGWDLLRSRDGGLTWASLDCPAVAEGIAQIAVSGNALLVAPRDSALGLLRSTNGGRTWRSVLAGGDGEDFRALTADPFSQTAQVIRREALWISSDGGATWVRRTERAPDGAFGFAADPQQAVLYAAGGALSRSVNGGRTWNMVLRIPSEESPTSQVAFQKGDPSHMVFVIGHQLYLSRDGGLSCRLVGSPSDLALNTVAIDPRDPNRMFGGGTYSTAVTGDGGRTWTRKSWDYVELLAWPAGRTLWAGGCGVSVSRDGGRTWRESLPCAPPVPRAEGRYVQKLEVDPAHPSVVYALTFLDRDFYPNHGPLDWPLTLWRSRDGGATWKAVAEDLDAFALDRESSRLYASRGLDLLVSDDGGDHWRALTRLPSVVTDLAVPAGLPDTLYAAASPALLRSQDGGRTWERFDQGFAPDEFLLAVHPTDSRTVYAQSWKGLFHIALP